MKTKYLFFTLILLIMSHFRGVAQDNLSGIYSFSENLGENVSGTPVQYYYTIKVFRKAGAYQAKYMVDGYQMMLELDCSVVTDGKNFTLKFEKYGEDSMIPPAIHYQSGQKLMTVSHQSGQKYNVAYASDFPYDRNANKTYQYTKE